MLSDLVQRVRFEPKLLHAYNDPELALEVILTYLVGALCQFELNLFSLVLKCLHQGAVQVSVQLGHSFQELIL